MNDLIEVNGLLRGGSRFTTRCDDCRMGSDGFYKCFWGSRLVAEYSISDVIWITYKYN